MQKDKYSNLADNGTIETAKQALEKNGFSVIITENIEEAKKKVYELIPEGKEVMTATSTTLDQMGLTDEINDSGKYNSIKLQLTKLDREKDNLKMQQLGAAPEYVIGSVHAVTTDGKVIIASNTGSQLPSYSYGASHVVWVVSTKKITKDLDDGIKRVYEHVLPLESIRVQKAYGMPNSEIKKMLIIHKEINPERITIVFVKEDLGF